MIRVKRQIEDPKDLEFFYYIYISRMNNKFLDTLVLSVLCEFFLFFFLLVRTNKFYLIACCI